MAGQVFGGSKPAPAPQPMRAVGQDAVLNGKPVKWGGDNYGWQSPESFNTIKQPTSATASYQGPGGDPSGSGLGQAQQNPAAVSPRMGAATDSIAYAEGTWDKENDQPDYTMRYGDRKGQGTLDTSKPHPEDVRTSIYGSGLRSNASGAFQFLDNTWKEQFGGQNVVMTPENQDIGAVQLLRSTGFDEGGDFKTEISKASGKWASIPNRHGKSDHNQPVHHNVDELNNFYEQRIAKREHDNRLRVYAERGGAGTSSAASFQPPAEMAGHQQNQEPTPITAPTPAPVGSDSYSVQQGDTLYGLAKRFGTSVDELARRNNIRDVNQLAIGHSLRY